MLSNYTKQTITWSTKTNTGYGNGFSSPVNVNNVYIEKSLTLSRGVDDTTSSDAWFIVFTDIAFKVGDRIKMKSQKYIVTNVETFYKPRGTAFKQRQVSMKEVNNG